MGTVPLLCQMWILKSPQSRAVAAASCSSVVWAMGRYISYSMAEMGAPSS